MLSTNAKWLAVNWVGEVRYDKYFDRYQAAYDWLMEQKTYTSRKILEV